jgi:UDP-N-acetylglucosamine 2-epimerase (non-hydrolysing)
MFVVGTRPEAIKTAPLIRAVGADPRLEPIVVSTGQHREMLASVLDLFEIRPDRELDVMEDRQALGRLTERVLGGMTQSLEELKPQALVVQGDTTSAMAAALAAFYARVPVVHLEAGLRSGDLANPFPEEANRRLIAVLTRLHLAPTATAANALKAEGHPEGSIVTTGNTVIDALLWASALQRPWEDPALAVLDDDDRRMILVTAHRRESWGPAMNSIGAALARMAKDRPDILFVLPVHKNPAVRESLLPAVDGLENVLVVEAVAYASFCRLLGRCHIVLTDSGGVQEEAPSLGKPVLVMRTVTERTEGVDAGTARLVPPNGDDVEAAVLGLLDDPAEYELMARAVNPYGDGRAAQRSAAAIRDMLGVGDRVPDFSREN